MLFISTFCQKRRNLLYCELYITPTLPAKRNEENAEDENMSGMKEIQSCRRKVAVPFKALKMIKVHFDARGMTFFRFDLIDWSATWEKSKNLIRNLISLILLNKVKISYN